MSMKFTVPLAFAAVLMSSLAAFAAATTATNTVKSIDAKKNEIVLNDGKTYELPKKFKTDGIKAGEKVMITFEVKNGKNVASKVEMAK